MLPEYNLRETAYFRSQRCLETRVEVGISKKKNNLNFLCKFLAFVMISFNLVLEIL